MDFCKIFIVTHKKFKIPQDTIFYSLQVGGNSDNFDGCIRDNTLDNISSKNSNYCELTALYWLWKNLKSVSNIGVCHYRRYFTSKFWSKNEKYFIKEDKIKEYLKEYDIIVPKKLYHNSTVRNCYYTSREGKEKDLLLMEKILFEKYPDYIESYKKIMYSHSAYYCNMFIMSKENFDHYCEWLFNILFELEKSVDLKGYTVQEQRIYGFLSETLLDVWVDKNHLNFVEIDTVNTELQIYRIFTRKIKNYFYKLYSRRKYNEGNDYRY